jgi:endonuclease/exonuclease/phosphatase family metal-dependent hydrolase
MAKEYTGKWGTFIGRVRGVLVVAAGMLLTASLCTATPHADSLVPSIFRSHSMPADSIVHLSHFVLASTGLIFFVVSSLLTYVAVAAVKTITNSIEIGVRLCLVCCFWPGLCVSTILGQENISTANAEWGQDYNARSVGRNDLQTGPPLLTYPEIAQLYLQDVPPPHLRAKLNRLLTSPFVRNQTAAVAFQKPSSEELGKFLRVVQWNIERGLEFDAVRLAFTDPQKFSTLMDEKQSKASAAVRDVIVSQVRLLQQADLIVLNEVDWGVNRTLFRNVAAELADAFGMNYAYGVEFVEVDPITMGIDRQVVAQEVEETYTVPQESRSEMLEHIRNIMKPDPARYRGLHGTAILSRYRLENVRLVRFKFQGHDWYADEKKKTSDLAKIEGKLSMTVFKEQLLRQVRRGGRMMMLADIADPEVPSGRVTVVATHLEDMTTPANRRKQLGELLALIKGINHPVIVAGDMNTNTHNAAPIAVTRALKQRFGSAKWWAEEGTSRGIEYGTPFGWAYDLSFGLIGTIRKIDDPTAHSVPLLGENPEAKFFTTLQRFRFTDGGVFDFRGVRERSSNGRAGKLADSNERSEKGFVPTNELGRTYGPAGHYKIDWIFVKPSGYSETNPAKLSYRFAPHFGRTLKELNDSIPDRISDHSPIMLDLSLNEPSLRVSNPPE